jgi:hypothetical protein
MGHAVGRCCFCTSCIVHHLLPRSSNLDSTRQATYGVDYCVLLDGWRNDFHGERECFEFSHISKIKQANECYSPAIQSWQWKLTISTQCLYSLSRWASSPSSWHGSSLWSRSRGLLCGERLILYSSSETVRREHSHTYIHGLYIHKIEKGSGVQEEVI